MKLVLNIYTDDSLSEVKRVVEADRLKIPYRVTISVAELIESIDLETIEDKTLVKLITSNMGLVDKIIKASFGVTDTELECIDTLELIDVAKGIVGWSVDKFNSIKGNNSKNLAVTA